MTGRLALWFLGVTFSLAGCQPAAVPPAGVSVVPTPDSLVAQHILPDRAKTPGETRGPLPLSELCRSGHATHVRRELSDGEWIKLKRVVYARYGITHHQRGEYEVDHLISLELNGSNGLSNLFPQTQRTLWSAAVKDRLENVLHKNVCRGEMTLEAADTAIATNWIEAYKRYVGAEPQAVAPERD